MMGPSALGFPHFSNAAVMLSVLDFWSGFQGTFILIYKTKGFAVFRNLRVISMQFAVFLCYSVRCLYEFLCDFSIFVPPFLPPPHACMHVFSLTILIHISAGQLLISSFKHLKDERNIVNSTIPLYLYFLKLSCLLLLF